MNWTRRVVVTLAAAAALVASPAVALAADLPVPTTPVGPECRPGVVSSVLAALARNGVPLAPGKQFQYLQVTQGPDGYFVEPCVVTVPD